MTLEAFIERESRRWEPRYQVNVGIFAFNASGEWKKACWIEVITAAGEPLVSISESAHHLSHAVSLAAERYYEAIAKKNAIPPCMRSEA